MRTTGGRHSFSDVDTNFMYNWSMESSTIDEFWSHSWHANYFQKVASLLLYYNSVPAIIAGGLSATLSAKFLLISLGSAVEFQQAYVTRVSHGCGFIGLLVGLFSWRSRSRVFLDKACIHQTNARLKESGIKSIGGYLRATKTFLLLLDPTYPQRLWCVFEVAAFMHLSEQDTQRVKVTPVFSGVLCIGWLFVASTSFLVLSIEGLPGRIRACDNVLLAPVSALAASAEIFLIAAIARNYVAQVINLNEQLKTFSLAEARCFCCSVNHVAPETNQRIRCDRQLVEDVIERWFPQAGSFEHFVRLNVRKRVCQHKVFPYTYAVLASSGYSWGLFALAVWQNYTGAMFNSVRSLETCFGNMFLRGPIVLQMFVSMAKVMQQLPSGRFRGVLSTILVGLFATAPTHFLVKRVPSLLTLMLHEGLAVVTCWLYMIILAWFLYHKSAPTIYWTPLKATVATAFWCILAHVEFHDCRKFSLLGEE